MPPMAITPLVLLPLIFTPDGMTTAKVEKWPVTPLKRAIATVGSLAATGAPAALNVARPTQPPAEGT